MTNEQEVSMAASIQGCIQAAIESHNGVFSIFNMEELPQGAIAEYPVDFYSSNNDGRIYHAISEGEIVGQELKTMVVVPTYEIGGCIDWLISQEHRKCLVDRAINTFKESFIRKMDHDAALTLFAAGMDNTRYSTKFNNFFAKFIKANNPSKDAPIYVVANDRFFRQVARAYRRDSSETRIQFNFRGYEMVVFKHLGKIRLPFWKRLASLFLRSIAVIAQDTRGGFVMPIKHEPQVFDDPQLNPMHRTGFYGWAELGFAVLNNKKTMLGFCL